MNPRGRIQSIFTWKRGDELSEIHWQVSFALHERRNDQGAVSERDSVK